MKVEAFKVIELNKTPFVVVSQSAGNTYVELKNNHLNGNKIPLEELTVGSCFGVHVGDGRAKYYRIVGVGDGVVFAEKITKKEFDSCKQGINGVAGVVSILRAMGGVPKSDVEVLKRAINSKVKEYEEFERMKRKLDELTQKISKARELGINPSLYVSVLKDFTLSLGNEVREGRFEVSSVIKLPDYPYSHTINIVHDLGKRMFYIKANDFYVYFEKDGEKKASRSVEAWYVVMKGVEEYIKHNSDEQRKKIEEITEAIKSLSESVSKNAKQLSNNVTRALEVFLRKFGHRGEFRLDSREVGDLLVKNAPKEVVKHFVEDFGSTPMTIGIRMNSQGKIYGYYVNGRTFSTLPPEFVLPVLNLVRYYLIAIDGIVKVREKEINNVLKEIDGLVTNYRKKVEHFIGKLTELAETLSKEFPTRKTDYGVLIKVEGIDIGYNPKKKKVLFVREGSKYLYSSDRASLSSIEKAIAKIYSKLNLRRLNG